ncbi:MAG: flagellar biosynthesis protein FlhA [SAR86 cluster bacterium]|uniref:Flagellar biosynthesis protein FlhA n=1 Tax=SAR86 cluster bacterium TaxID=2030880 RepID=A0A2A5CBC0_9GAMM|nr:MAG: flagellar biosynthesis protein FlhA [SAR86 cluster bacterium]
MAFLSGTVSQGGLSGLNIRLAGMGAPVLIVLLLAMMLVPLPPFFLDFLFTFNIALSLVILLVAVYISRPLDFSVFPSVLLVATLLRLSLNVASTRVVLLEGHNGSGAAGKVIEAFGDFVVGGNYAVGLVVFAILVIINFVVVTKGAGRISEVTARFTLDAMPGKQMAIDADLNSGLIDQDAARTRREEVANEASFYGAMDGASKFVKGDAIAGILILFINVIGGFAIGMLQHDLSASQAATNYVLLTIGDGLVAQIPSLLLSTAAALIVTRVGSETDMGQQVMDQLFKSPKIFVITGGVIGSLGLIPGMPNVVFLTIAAALMGMAYKINQKEAIPEEEIEQEKPAEKDSQADFGWDDVLGVDIIGLEVGYRLIALVDKNQGGELLGRIKGVRKKISQELGFLIHSVHIHDNLSLAPNAYRITLLDVPVGEGEVHPGMEMAINPGQIFGDLEGIDGKDPAFNLDTVWIDSSQKEEAQTKGYTVVDCSTVIATHLSHTLRQHSHEMLGHDEVQKLLDALAKTAPKLVENLVPDVLPLGVILKVLQNLLEEGIPLRDMRTIVEALAEYGVQGQNSDVLTAAVRVALSRVIFQSVAGTGEEINVITVDPEMERILLDSVTDKETNRQLGIEPGLAETLLKEIQTKSQALEAQGKAPIILTSEQLRLWLYRFGRAANPGLKVLAYSEIPSNKKIKVVATLGQN